MAEAWFDPTTFAVAYGAFGGTLVGTLGGLLGGMIGLYAPKGKYRRFIMGALWFFIIVGLLNLGFGGAAILMRQPYGIWYPPMLVGLILVVVMGSLVPMVRRRYIEAESRRVEAESIRTL